MVVVLVKGRQSHRMYFVFQNARLATTYVLSITYHSINRTESDRNDPQTAKRRFPIQRVLFNLCCAEIKIMGRKESPENNEAKCPPEAALRRPVLPSANDHAKPNSST
jgi:hypothetical protein